MNSVWDWISVALFCTAVIGAAYLLVRALFNWWYR